MSENDHRLAPLPKAEVRRLHVPRTLRLHFIDALIVSAIAAFVANAGVAVGSIALAVVVATYGVLDRLDERVAERELTKDQVIDRALAAERYYDSLPPFHAHSEQARREAKETFDEVLSRGLIVRYVRKRERES